MLHTFPYKVALRSFFGRYTRVAGTFGYILKHGCIWYAMENT